MTQSSITDASASAVVVRFRVEHDRQWEFKSNVESVVSRDIVAEKSGAPVERVDVLLLQGLLSSGPAEWELRITLPNLESVGRFMDWASRAEDAGADSPLSRLLRFDGAFVVDAGVPLYRCWALAGNGSRE